MAEGIKQYPNKVEKNTADSETILLQKLADKAMESKKGISFYCSRRHTFMFIENTKYQNNGKIHSKNNTKTKTSSTDE